MQARAEGWCAYVRAEDWHADGSCSGGCGDSWRACVRRIDVLERISIKKQKEKGKERKGKEEKNRPGCGDSWRACVRRVGVRMCCVRMQISGKKEVKKEKGLL